MVIAFDQLPSTARIWIYQANRSLQPNEVALVTDRMATFMEGWRSHGENINVAMKLAYNQFLILAVDEQVNAASGCSIDSSVREVKALGEALQVDFLNKLKVAYLENDTVKTVSIPSFKALVARGEVTGDTLIFNNMITTKAALDQQWIIQAKQSWLSKYVKSESSI